MLILGNCVLPRWNVSSSDTAAFGDLRNGQGSLGVLPPEAILEKHLPCRPDQDVFAMGHLIFLLVAKNMYKSHNMWLSKVGALGALSRCPIFVG